MGQLIAFGLFFWAMNVPSQGPWRKLLIVVAAGVWIIDILVFDSGKARK